MESFLKCTPSVFVINNEYEIIVYANTNGILSVKIGEAIFYEENSGVLSSEKAFAKIRVPQALLDGEKKYEVLFRKTIDRKAYYSELSPVQRESFAFKPLQKTEDVHIYHVSDVHYLFDLAKRTAAFFGQETDLFVLNGDIGEVETEENYFEVLKFVGDISKGEVPVAFARGNHDTRGRLAEKYTQYFPCDGKNTFYTFEIGCLRGIILDCGEDKEDDMEEYGGVNDFASFRQRELAFLQSLNFPNDGKITFAISHICPVLTTKNKGNCFDIERDTYTKWNQELEHLKIRFMLTGHLHTAHIIDKDYEGNTLPHEYPVVVGSACFGEEDFWGAAITLNKESAEVSFTNANKEVKAREALVFD